MTGRWSSPAPALPKGRSWKARSRNSSRNSPRTNPKLAELVKLDAEKYEGVNFHVATIPIPDAEAKKSSASRCEIVVGISPSSLYFGAGKDPIATIKKAIDASKASPQKAIDPVEMVISATPIAKFFAKVIRPITRPTPRPRRTLPRPPRCSPSPAARIISR